MSELQEKQTGDKFGEGESRLIKGGLIAIELILTQTFITLGTYDFPATICIYAFAIAIPLLACNVVVSYWLAQHKVPTTNANANLYIAGSIASVIGIAAAFWHVSWIAGTLFLVSGTIGFGVYWRYV